VPDSIVIYAAYFYVVVKENGSDSNRSIGLYNCGVFKQ